MPTSLTASCWFCLVLEDGGCREPEAGPVLGARGAGDEACNALV